MKKPISRSMHGVAEYSYIPLSAAAPELFGFKNNGKATKLARLVGATVLASAITTRAEWGIFKLVPFKTHLKTDVVLGIVTASAPLLLGFSRESRARNAFIALGLISIIVPLLTRNEEMKHG